jgi:dihydroorotase-like cyclic amidohydrolase
LIPGVIDGHVHLSAKTKKSGGEDIVSGSKAAAIGGVTYIGIMPQLETLTGNRNTLLENKVKYENRCSTDFSLLGGFSGGEDNDFSKFIPELWEEGVISIKGYMHNHRPHRELKASYDGEMLWALEEIAKVGAIASVHCENEWMQDWNRRKIMAGTKRDVEEYLKFSPPIVEYEAGVRFFYFCKHTGARGLAVHTSMPELVMEALHGRREGYPLYIETCPHYLYFSEEDFKKRGIWLKCAPTLRDKDTVRKMWTMLDKGYIETIASDHVPAPYDELLIAHESGNVFDSGAGFPNIEHMVDSLMNGVNTGLANLAEVVNTLTYKPAKLYGLYPKKGVIRVGSDADLVVIDMKKEKKITREGAKTKAGWTTFDGTSLKGIPVMTFLSGEIIVQDGEFIGETCGKYLPRLDSKASINL